MDRIDQQRLAAILLHAPVWARLGLAVRDERLRERAADTLAGIVAAKLGDTGSSANSEGGGTPARPPFQRRP